MNSWVKYYYGMKARGYSKGCQPMIGLIGRRDDISGKYFDIIVYDHRLTEDETTEYELDYIGTAI